MDATEKSQCSDLFDRDLRAALDKLSSAEGLDMEPLLHGICSLLKQQEQRRGSDSLPLLLFDHHALLSAMARACAWILEQGVPRDRGRELHCGGH